MTEIVAEVAARYQNGNVPADGSLMARLLALLGFQGSHLVNTFWSGGLTGESIVSNHHLFV